MTPEELEVERAAFEAWARSLGYQDDELDRCTIAIVCPEYYNLNTEMAWNAWASRAELVHAERREMQETEQRLRAEIARLQAIADRAVPDGWKLAPVEPNEAMLKKGALAYSQKERDMYSPTPTEEPGIGSEGYCYLAMLAAAPQPAEQAQDDAELLRDIYRDAINPDTASPDSVAWESLRSRLAARLGVIDK